MLGTNPFLTFAAKCSRFFSLTPTVNETTRARNEGANDELL
jgi:hypothetical protein